MVDSPALEISGLQHRFADAQSTTLSLPVLTIAAGEKVALIGTSGAGKSTLLRLIDGRLRGWSGRARVLGVDLSPDRAPPRAHRRRTGFIFQEYALIEQASVFRNVLNGRLGHMASWASLAGTYSAADAALVTAVLDATEIGAFAARRAERLSGGQRQRVAVARCLVQEPAMILADEPIASLDPVNARSILSTLVRSAAQRGATLVISSHQPQLVADYVDRFVALDSGSVTYDGPASAFGASEFSSVYGAATDARAADQATGP
ncbi:MAG: phosphonate ABC transporter ATP-binding protein [Alphaproteobacteria bacterium]